MKRVIKDFNRDEILLNVFYEVGRDSLLITSKNVHTGIKTLREYPKPKVPVYISNERNIKTYKEFEYKDKLREEWVSYLWREYELARILEIHDFTERVRKNEMQRKHIHLDRRLFSTDIHIEDWVMREYFKFCLTIDEKGEYNIDFPVIESFHLGGLDIETDIMGEGELNDYPVILNTAIDNKTWKVLTVCLINDKYKGQKEVMENIEQFNKDFKETLINHINGITLSDKGKADKIRSILLEMANKLHVELIFTNDEREVIKQPVEHLFKKVNPDFCYAYNAQFDIGHMKTRAEFLGMDYDALFQYKDLPIYNVFNYKNQDPDPKVREHHYNSHNPTKIIDQLLQYAQLRRSKLYAKYSLDAVAKRELGVAKLDYSKICSYIGDFPYVDWKSFTMYNIIDVFVMLCLDRITNDTYAQVYSRFNLCTEWGRLARPMRRTTNVFDTLAMTQGYIPGNELNSIFINLEKKKLKKIQEKDPDLYRMINQLITANTKNKEDNPYRIQGGHVSSPNLISSKIKKSKLYNVPILTYNRLENCCDLDAKAMYPNNTQANNGSKTTLYGIMESINKKTGDNISQLGALSLLNENFSSMGHYFFNLPLAEDLIREYYNITPKYKKRIEEVSGYYNEEFLEYDPKNKFLEGYRKLLKKLYTSKFGDKEKEAGNPTLSTYFFSDDTNKIVLSYYNTKITMELLSDKTFNQLNGIENKGFICGNVIVKENMIKNYNDEYISYMIPTKKYPNISDIKHSSLVSTEVRDEIMKAKIRPIDLNFGKYKITLLNRGIFWDNSSGDLNVHIYDLLDDENLALAHFVTDYKLPLKTALRVSQDIVFYKV